MHTRKSFPIWAVVLLLIAALATMGLVYGHWFDTLRVDGTVDTGELDAQFIGTFTDDGGHVDDPAFDAGDILCPGDSGCIFGGADGARDPKGPGPNPDRYDKAIGHCASGINPDGTLWFDLDNVYPSYYCTVWADINNPASIPWMFTGERYHYDLDAIELIWAPDTPSCGDQVDPGKVVRAGLTIHVKQDAVENGHYTGWYEIGVVNWNEFDDDMCTSEYVP